MNDFGLNQITAARVVENNVVELQFGDGYVGLIDLTPALWGPVFEPLRDADYFHQFRIEDGTMRWPNDADFCPDVLRFWCEAGGVKTTEETDAHFIRQLSHRAAS